MGTTMITIQPFDVVVTKLFGISSSDKSSDLPGTRRDTICYSLRPRTDPENGLNRFMVQHLILLVMAFADLYFHDPVRCYDARDSFGRNRCEWSRKAVNQTLNQGILTPGSWVVQASTAEMTAAIIGKPSLLKMTWRGNPRCLSCYCYLE